MVLDSDDATEHLRETVQEDLAERKAQVETQEREARFRRRAALVVAALAALLAITSLGGQNATKTMIDANIQASDTYAFFQAKNIRQTSNLLAADTLQTLLELNPTADAATRAAIEGRIERYRATAARYESEPETGEGKRELLARAQEWVRRRDRAEEQDPNFDYAAALFQLAIVLSSVAIIAVSRPVLIGALVLATVAAGLTLNGFRLLFHMPIG
jgi:hypothetical protein